MLTTLATLAQGPVIGGLGPGSSRDDYASVGLPFEVYPVEPRLAPIPDPPPQIWFGSWGSDRRLSAMAAVADGWFASAYNATPHQYAEGRARLDDHLRAAGREPATFPDAIATMWCYVTDSRQEAEHLLADVLAPALNRDPAQLADLPIGGAQHCAEVLARYSAAGAREVLVWPIRGGVRQLERCMAAASST